MRELPTALKHATVWALIGLALFLGVQAWLARQQATRFVPGNGVVELRRASDGHYHWPATLAGRSVEFLVDTGASRSAIPAALARELGLPVEGTVRSSTAGGLVDGTLVRADLALRGGPRVERLRLTALPDLHAPLLGMDVLGRLVLQQRDGVLRVEVPR